MKKESKYKITVKNVSKTFHDLTAVKNLSFSVNKASCFSILGPNGAGKTTMLNMLYARTKRDVLNGSIINVMGYDPAINELEIKYLSGIVPQENNLDDELSVEQNLYVYARFYGFTKNMIKDRIGYLLDFMELAEKRKTRIRELSGGMKRRLIIARSLLNDPELLILDEPTTGLDPQVRQLIWDKLRLLKKNGVTILLTTHYMDEAYQLSDSLIIMNGGEKVLEGSPGELVRNNMEKYVFELFSLEKEKLISLNKNLRREKTPSRILYYTDDISIFSRTEKKFTAGEYYIRQSNLEDLFLKITGRGLNE